MHADTDILRRRGADARRVAGWPGGRPAATCVLLLTC